ncbi:hypothetical protein [Paraburkholderia sp. Ac-20347]|uniref:hypothetical protein n=1 Tax=Paraburkholderia sp. Ac-20347 TaxID=2703892 RepID=UPI001981D260|nr:hypothetical protein [Paraburkholderia sp. Ac-20347]MBN3809984.1 hypothetical protein [Paraburkholderia sp. Ac-20347]
MNRASPPSPPSPYTPRNLDAAIAHLERAIEADREAAVFGLHYWLERVQQALATPGIVIAQTRRLEHLRQRLVVSAEAATAINSR